MTARISSPGKRDLYFTQRMTLAEDVAQLNDDAHAVVVVAKRLFTRGWNHLEGSVA